MRKAILKIYGWILGVGLAYFLWGEITGLYLPCYFYRSTGLQCPGCGTSRMFLALLRGDVAQAFACNGAMFVILGVWNLIALLCFVGWPGFVRRPWFLYTCLGISLAGLLVFTFLRNALTFGIVSGII